MGNKMGNKITRKEIDGVAGDVLSNLGIEKTFDEMLDDYKLTPVKLKYLLVYCKLLEYKLNVISEHFKLSSIHTEFEKQVIEKLNKTLATLREQSGNWE